MRQQLQQVLKRLWHDRAGNVLIMMTAMLTGLVAFAGSAVDASRLYVVNTRLHQACDAGVLAGRKQMTDTATNTPLDTAASTAAQSFFTSNFPAGFYGTSGLTFTPAKSASGQVSGTATVNVPMTIMQMFGKSTVAVTVTCEASFNTADTDIMFVLDTTGSMACLPSDDDATCSSYVGSAGTTSYSRPTDGSASGNTSVAGYPGSTAYYVPEKSGSRIAALRSAVVSFYDTLAGAIDPTTKVRYGFVTYTSTVNAGRALMDKSTGYVTGGLASGQTNWTYQSRYQTGTSFSYWSGTQPTWQYQPMSLLLTTYVLGTGTVDSSKSPAGTSRWDGCVEAPATTAGTTSFTQSSLPDDLNPDSVPTTTLSTQWKPMWSDAIYARNNYGSTDTGYSTGDSNSHPWIGSALYKQYGYVSCGKPVKRLAVMSRSDVSNYVNASDFRAIGGTYHDTGMIWGTRLISPTGMFASDTATWPGNNPPNRVIVFMTDGDMAPSTGIYGMYGVEYYDRRVSGGDFTNLTAYHNARFLAVCDAAKARNISVWTIAIDSAVTTPLQSCATTSAQALATTSGAGLTAAFQTIAKQVAKLRLTR